MSSESGGPDDPAALPPADGGDQAGAAAQQRDVAPVPRLGADAAPMAPVVQGQDEDITLDLPEALRPKPPREPRVSHASSPLVRVVLVLLVIAVISGVAFYARGEGQGGDSTLPPGCADQNSPCQVAHDYVVEYAAGKYDAMYQFVSNASKTRFGDNAILSGNYANAHDYIVNRTQSLLAAAQVYSVQVTTGDQRFTGQSTAIVPAHVVMQTIRVGTITQDINLPLVLEQGNWRVSWSPGLVFAQLDDANDPQYQRRLHLFLYDGHRGRILAADGTVLADDETVYTVGVVPGQIKNESTMLQTLAKDLDFTPSQIKQLYQQAGASTFVPVRTIAQALYAHVQPDLAPLQGAGVQIEQAVRRVYPYGADTAAVTGYVAPVSDQDLVNDSDHYYESNDFIGRAGIETWAEQQLRPVKGGELDILPLNPDGTYGAPSYTIARRAPADGADVHTGINIALQQRAMADMRKAPHPSGTAVLDPTTGAVLALASNPIYDPNDFSLGFTPNESVRFQALDHPYLDRAVQSAYPIGSAFKVTTLAAALESGVPTNKVFDCEGTFLVPGQPTPLHDWVAHGHGNLTEIMALAESCDVVFWQIGVSLNAQNPNLLPNMAKGFGYGAKTGIVGLPNDEETAGLVPDPAWLQQTQNAGWSPIDAANLSIGQGFFQASPLQMAVVSAAVADNGQRLQPRLVMSVVKPDGQTVFSSTVKVVGTLPLSADHLAVLQAAMLGPTTDPHGTSYGVFGHFPVLVGGKTGTAESGSASPHSVFLAYAPAAPLSGTPTPPRIALATLIENQGHGVDYAAPLVKDLLKSFFGVSG